MTVASFSVWRESVMSSDAQIYIHSRSWVIGWLWMLKCYGGYWTNSFYNRNRSKCSELFVMGLANYLTNSFRCGYFLDNIRRNKILDQAHWHATKFPQKKQINKIKSYTVKRLYKIDKLFIYILTSFWNGELELSKNIIYTRFQNHLNLRGW